MVHAAESNFTANLLRASLAKRSADVTSPNRLPPRSAIQPSSRRLFFAPDICSVANGRSGLDDFLAMIRHVFRGQRYSHQTGVIKSQRLDVRVSMSS
jgi:hypothetical protein